MLLVTAPNGRVGHVVSAVRLDGEQWVVDMVCGKSYTEPGLVANQDYDNACASCSGKVEVDPEPVDDVESTPEPKAEKPKSSDK